MQVCLNHTSDLSIFRPGVLDPIIASADLKDPTMDMVIKYTCIIK